MESFVQRLIQNQKLFKFILKIFSVNKWQLFIAVVFTAEFFTFILNSFQSYLWWGYWSGELIIIGTIDALIIAIIMTPLFILLIQQIVRFEEFKRKALEQSALEKAVFDKDKKFRLLIENNQDVITIIDKNGFIQYESPSIYDIFGYTTTELIGKNVFNYIHPEDRTSIVELYKKALAIKGFTESFECRFMKANGEWANLSISGVNLIHDPFVNGIFVTSKDITDRVKMEERLKKTLHEKDILIKEIHHRVKNNFHSISGLLLLQRNSTSDQKTSDILLDCQNRINTMALIHEKLYMTDNISEIDLNSYIQRLVKFIQSSFNISDSNIRFIMNLEQNIILDSERSVAVGLIINELLTNIYKYAFPDGRSGNISISIMKKGKACYLLLKDDGIGLPADFDIENSKSLGLKIVKMMINQIQGKLSISSHKGTEFSVEFPV